MRPIDADKLTSELKNLSQLNESPYWQGRAAGRNDALVYISKQPTINNYLKNDAKTMTKIEQVAKTLCRTMGCSECPGYDLCDISEEKDYNGLTKWLAQCLTKEK